MVTSRLSLTEKEVNKLKRCGGTLFEDMTYADALDAVMSNPSTTYKLRQRIAEDQKRDPVDSLNDAEVLCALQRLRLDALVEAAQKIVRH